MIIDLFMEHGDKAVRFGFGEKLAQTFNYRAIVFILEV